jgi:hypothetical protein
MSVSTNLPSCSAWFSVDSPDAWNRVTNADDLYHNSLLSNLSKSKFLSHFSGVEKRASSNGNVSSPTSATEWFQLPTNSSMQADNLNWDDFVPEAYWETSRVDPSKKEPFNYPSVIGSGTALTNSAAAAAAAHRNVDIEAELSRQNLYKTELCRSWVESASCKYGPKCQFAHGQHELRPVIRHPKYKTEICKTFHTNGTCPYGKRCRFVHNPAEIRLMQDENAVDDAIQQQPEDIRELQEQFKLTQLSPDPVFLTQSLSVRDIRDGGVHETSVATTSKIGSSLPFFQKLRRQKF